LSFESDSSKRYRELDFVSCEVEEGKAGSTASPRASPAWPAPRLPVMAWPRQRARAERRTASVRAAAQPSAQPRTASCSLTWGRWVWWGGCWVD